MKVSPLQASSTGRVWRYFISPSYINSPKQDCNYSVKEKKTDLWFDDSEGNNPNK